MCSSDTRSGRRETGGRTAGTQPGPNRSDGRSNQGREETKGGHDDHLQHPPHPDRHACAARHVGVHVRSASRRHGRRCAFQSTAEADTSTTRPDVVTSTAPIDPGTDTTTPATPTTTPTQPEEPACEFDPDESSFIEDPSPLGPDDLCEVFDNQPSMIGADYQRAFPCPTVGSCGCSRTPSCRQRTGPAGPQAGSAERRQLRAAATGTSGTRRRICSRM